MRYNAIRREGTNGTVRILVAMAMAMAMAIFVK
jgi:hypothetical protein